MSVYYKVVCHDCKEQVNLAGYTDEFVAKTAGEWAMNKHITHSVAVFNDILGWDMEYDKRYDSTEGYKEIELVEEDSD